MFNEVNCRNITIACHFIKTETRIGQKILINLSECAFNCHISIEIMNIFIYSLYNQLWATNSNYYFIRCFRLMSRYLVFAREQLLQFKTITFLSFFANAFTKFQTWWWRFFFLNQPSCDNYGLKGIFKVVWNFSGSPFCPNVPCCPGLPCFAPVFF